MSNLSRIWDRQSCDLCRGALTIRGSDFLVCTKCSLMLRRSAGDMEKLYQSGWQRPLENLNLTGGTTSGLGINYSRELIRTLGLNSLNGKKILDFGGGRGELALALESLGAKVIVVDPFSFSNLQEIGLDAVASLDQLSEEHYFDGAVSIDVIEHLTTPWEELQIIKSLLRKGGWFYLSTPNAGGLNAMIYRENWRESQNPSHLLLFTPKSIEYLMQKGGFERYQRLKWNVKFSENKLVQVKDWFLRSIWMDGVLRYIAFV